ncbi:Sensor histidine kinase RcsC [Pseudoalteromonas sp. CIP111854]|uniref:Sensor protein FixL n=1 Tax=Pseudoalteromonas holothuriae TaxID=2963714 RepID=A0A9W4QUN0_9GAMM|nr:PAS domain-containing hybrid sensor histidine kinase/response regulator [Pseudoalteromonas sp. CIP111854]CAH9053886.1 Sensor histidine kinase RcsC [Pseudoalteromonas sp. CIP111854]
MKISESVPYPYMVTLLVTMCMATLYFFAQQRFTENSINTLSANQLQQLENTLQRFEASSKHQNSKTLFLAWSAPSGIKHTHTTYEYLISTKSTKVLATTNNVDMSKRLAEISPSASRFEGLKESELAIFSDKTVLHGAIKVCSTDASAQSLCYLYYVKYNLPQRLTALQFDFLLLFIGCGILLIVLITSYIKLKVRPLNKALFNFPSSQKFDNKTGDEFSKIVQNLSSIEAQSKADKLQLETELSQKEILSSQLHSQYSRISAIINTVVDGIITIDKNGIVETFNPAAQTIFGYQSSEVIGKNVKMLMPSPYQEEHDHYVANYLKTNKAKIIGSGREVLGQRANGELFPMELSVSEMSVDGQRMFTGIVKDISDIAQQKSLLSDQVARIKAIIETVIDGIITINDKGLVDSLNPAAERIFGYKEHEVIGNNIKMLMPAPYQQEHDQYLVNYITGGEKKVIGSGRDVLGKRKDGSIFSMSLAVSEMDVNGERMFTGIVRDISGIAQQKALLDDQVSRIKAIIETVIDGIITIDDKGLVDSFNPAAEKIFGYQEHEVIGKNIKMLMPAPYQQEHDQYLANYMTSGIKKIIGSGREVLGRKKDGSVFSMSLAVSEMFVGDKKMFTGIVRDITEQKKYEAALNQYRQDLEEQVIQRTSDLEAATKQAQSASHAKSKFLSRMSHELRTPLNAIIGFTQLLEEENLTLSQTDSLKEISTAGKDLALMVNEILQIASIQTGNLSLSLEEVSLNESLQESIEQLLSAANNKNISVSFDNDIQFYVKADYAKLKQVITSLIDNAIRYSNDHSSISIKLVRNSNDVSTHIIDTGIGISARRLKHIFEPFERGGDQYTGEEGVGIGLTIAKEFTEAMGGFMRIQSTEGEGTTATFDLPLIREETLCETNVNSVLYIEDNATNRKLMKRLVNRFDNIVYHEAVNGYSGIEAAKSLKPSLILLDINLPDISGYEVFQALKNHEDTKNIAIVGISANAMSTDQDKAKDLGFTSYITKPIELDELKATFETLLH